MELLEEEAQVLKSQPSKMVEARDPVAVNLSSRQIEVETLGACVRLLSDELDSLKRHEFTDCNIEVMPLKLADDRGEITSLISCLHRNILISYDSTLHGVYGAVGEVCRCPKEAFDREAQNLLQKVRDTICGAAKKNRGSFANAPDATDKWRRVIVERATCASQMA